MLNGHQCPSVHFRNVSTVDSRGFQVVVAVQFVVVNLIFYVYLGSIFGCHTNKARVGIHNGFDEVAAHP